VFWDLPISHPTTNCCGLDSSWLNYLLTSKINPNIECPLEFNFITYLEDWKRSGEHNINSLQINWHWHSLFFPILIFRNRLGNFQIDHWHILRNGNFSNYFFFDKKLQLQKYLKYPLVVKYNLKRRRHPNNFLMIWKCNVCLKIVSPSPSLQSVHC
jgi:hypothetical protein